MSPLTDDLNSLSLTMLVLSTISHALKMQFKVLLHHNEIRCNISLFHIHYSRKGIFNLVLVPSSPSCLNLRDRNGPTMEALAQFPRLTNAFVNEPFYFYIPLHIICVFSSLACVLPHCFISHVLLRIQLLS